jgi:hypothetical protein
MSWLLTSGWNMILVARRPTCLPGAAELDGWEVGRTCQVGRVGIAFAMIALCVYPKRDHTLANNWQDGVVRTVWNASNREPTVRSAFAQLQTYATCPHANNHT